MKIDLIENIQMPEISEQFVVDLKTKIQKKEDRGLNSFYKTKDFCANISIFKILNNQCKNNNGEYRIIKVRIGNNKKELEFQKCFSKQELSFKKDFNMYQNYETENSNSFYKEKETDFSDLTSSHCKAEIDSQKIIKKFHKSFRIKIYLISLLFFIGIFVLCGLIVLIFGVCMTNKIKQIFTLNFVLNNCVSNFFQSQLNLFSNIEIIDKNNKEKTSMNSTLFNSFMNNNEKTNKTIGRLYHHDENDDNIFYQNLHMKGVEIDIQKYLFIELDLKLDMFSKNLDLVVSLAYSIKDEEIYDSFFNKIFQYNFLMTKNRKIIEQQKDIKFVNLIETYISLVKNVMSNPDIKQKIYIIDRKVSEWDLDNLNNSELTEYQKSIYGILLNFQNILAIFKFYKNFLNLKFETLISDFYNFIFIFWVILISAHMILIVISYFILTLFKEILYQNFSMVEFMCIGERFNYLVHKNTKLKKLIGLYLENPKELISDLRKNKKIFYDKMNNYAILYAKSKNLNYHNKAIIGSNNLHNNSEKSVFENFNHQTDLSEKPIINSKSKKFVNTVVKEAYIYHNSKSIKNNKFIEDNLNDHPPLYTENANEYVLKSQHLKTYFKKFTCIENGEILINLKKFLIKVFLIYYIYSLIMYVVFTHIQKSVIEQNNLAEQNWDLNQKILNNVCY